MKPTDSSTNDIPYFVGSYSEAQNHYNAGVDGKLGIASAIYPATDSDLRSADFPYRQMIRGDGACYLNACLVGILNKCVGDEERWRKFKANVINIGVEAERIINQIELRAKTNSDGTSPNGLDRKKLNQMLQEKGNENLGTQLAKAILIPKHQELIKKYDDKIAKQEKVIEEAESNKIKYTHDYLNAFNEYLKTTDGSKLPYKTPPTFDGNYKEKVKIMTNHFLAIHNHQQNDPDQNNPFKKLRELAGNPSARYDKSGTFKNIPNKINGVRLSINSCAIYKNYISESDNDFATSYEESMIAPIVKELTLGMINQGQSIDIQTFENINFQNPDLIQNFDPNAIYLHNADGVSHFSLIYSKEDPICVELESQKNQATKTRDSKKANEQQECSKLVNEIKELQNKSQDVDQDLINSIIDNKELENVDLEILKLLKSIYEASTKEAQVSKISVKNEAEKILMESKTAGDSTKTSTPIDYPLDPKILFNLALEEIIKNNKPSPELFETYLQAIKQVDPATQDENFLRQLSHTAAKLGKSDFIAPLIKILPDSFKTIESFDNTPLMWAIANAKNDFAFNLLEQSKASNVDIGIDHISEQFGTNALHLATVKGYTLKDKDGNDVKITNSKLVKKLIESGANPNIETSLGLSALDIGVLRADSELVESILLSSKIKKHTILSAIEKIDSLSFDEAINKLQKTCTFFNDADKSSFDSNKTNIKKILLESLSKKFPESNQELEDKRKTDFIIKKQLKIFNQLFEQNRVKKDKKKILKDHVVGEGMDWWVFPGYTNNKDPDKFTATEEIYTRLARDREYCKRYKTFIYQYMDSFDIDEKIKYKIRFFKLVESLIGMTDNGKRTLAGFTQKEQDILFIAVNNFYEKQDPESFIDYQNYKGHFENLKKIADASKETEAFNKENKTIWIIAARKKLKERLELNEDETSSTAIKKMENYPIFENGKELNQEQKNDFDLRSSPYSLDNKIGCGTFKEKIEDKEVSYPFCHFRITHDRIASRNDDSTKDEDKVKLIDEVEYLKHPPITAICIDYPDYRNRENLPSSQELRNIYKQKTLETLTLYDKLEVDHLVKHGDGMGVFLKQTKINGTRTNRAYKTISNAMRDYLDGFFEAVSEFYQKNPNATLKKITFVTPDEGLEKIFDEKLVAFKKSDSNSVTLGVVEFKRDKAGPRFNIYTCYSKGTKKLGMTIAPNCDKMFLGGALREGNVLEEQIALLSDMASIGNPVFNPNVTKKLCIFKEQDSNYCTFFHQDKYDSPVIEFNTEKDSKFNYKKILNKDEIYKSEDFTKDKEQEEILKLLIQAKDKTLTQFKIKEIDNNFFIAVMKVASKHSGIASISEDNFNNDLKEALEKLSSSADSLDSKADQNFHKIAKYFSANFQELSKEKKYLTAKPGVSENTINPIGRRLFRVCTEENINAFKEKLNSPSTSPSSPRSNLDPLANREISP